MPIYLLEAIYHHAVIGLVHITEGVLVMHLASMAILTTVAITMDAQVHGGTSKGFPAASITTKAQVHEPLARESPVEATTTKAQFPGSPASGSPGEHSGLVTLTDLTGREWEES